MTPTDLGNDPGGALWMSLLKAVEEHESFRGDRDLKKDLGRMKDAAISSLAERLLRNAPAEACWLVILDQMEELFAAEMKEAGAVFLDRLIEATRPPRRVRVVATVRGDLFHHCLDHPGLRQVVRGGGVYPLGRPDRRSLEQMVSGPLNEVELILKPGKRWVLDPELPAMIAVDAERHAGGLALMAFALRELYDRCERSRHMNVATWRSEEFGGLGGAIRRKATETLRSLGADGEKALEKVFARLVRVDHPEDAATRLRERLSVWDSDEAALRVIGKFQEARLLVSVIEVAHEALLREWPALALWIEERREALHLRERVKAETQIWVRGDESSRRQRPWRADLIDDHRKTLEAAGLLDPLLKDPGVARLLTPEVEWILGELAWDETSNLRRWEIGRRLAEIGDPRPGVGVINGVPDILWRPILGGIVEIEGHGKFPVEPFEMAVYPVTFAQFRAFLNAQDGYADQRWWNGLNLEDSVPAWESTLTNHPVTDVSWFDATAFCRWLSARLDRGVRLPDEWEWQQAAQSGKEYEYPWGPKWLDGRANTRESDIQHKTAVGMFPRGDSEQRVSDLAGNVWEWCRNEYKHPRESGAAGDEEPRVVRGGSWDFLDVVAHAGRRHDHHPSVRFNALGFRVASSPIGNAGR